MEIIRGIKPEFIDERGEITRLLDKTIQSVLLITCKKGSIRSNHYHKKDSHWVYIQSGKFEWYEMVIRKTKLEKKILEAGDMVFTPSNVIHANKALEDGVQLAFCTQSRDQIDYEKDTIRVKLI